MHRKPNGDMGVLDAETVTVSIVATNTQMLVSKDCIGPEQWCEMQNPDEPKKTYYHTVTKDTREIFDLVLAFDFRPYSEEAAYQLEICGSGPGDYVRKRTVRKKGNKPTTRVYTFSEVGKRMKRAGLAVIVLWVITSVAETEPALFETTIQNLRDNLNDTKDTAEIRALLSETPEDFALYAALDRTRSQVYALLEERRIDKQIGASPTSSGTTLVSKGSTPYLLGFPVESRALYRSVSGNIVTLRLNPIGLVRVIANQTYVDSGVPMDPTALEDVVSRFSLSAGFDVPEDSFPTTFDEALSQLREVNARVELINERDPGNPSHQEAIEKLVGNLTDVANAVARLAEELRALRSYELWLDAAAVRLTHTDLDNDEETSAALQEIGDKFTTMIDDGGMSSTVDAIVSQFVAYNTDRQKILDEIGRSLTLSVEYSYSTLPVPADVLDDIPDDFAAPHLSTGTVILSLPIRNDGELTFTGSASFFHSKIPEMDWALRDVQLAASLDFRIPNVLSLGYPVLTFAARGVYLFQQPFGQRVPVQGVKTADGIMGLFQAKLTIPTGQNGIKIPISLTVASRNELNTEEWQPSGSIGLTFDPDVLFSRS